MILLFPELHPFNALLCWALSRVVEVRVLYVHPACDRLIGRRIAQLDPSAFLSSREGWAVREAAASRWERIVPRIPGMPWRARARGIELDFSAKAKQDAAQIFQDACLLQDIRRRHPFPERVWCLPSAAQAWIAGLEGELGDRKAPRAVAWLSRLNVLCDRLWSQQVNTVRLVRLLVRLARGLAERLRPSRQTLGPCRYLYWCDGAVDIRRDVEKRSLWWIVDQEAIRPQDVVVLLPFTPSRRVWPPSVASQGAYQAYTFPACYARSPAPALWRAVGDALALLVRCAFQPVASLERLWMTGYLAAAAQLQPVVDTLRPAYFIECDNSLGIEDPALVPLNQAGITTVMYHTSAMMPSTQMRASARDLMHADILASVVVCWSEAAARFLTAHPQQPGTRFDVLSPILPGSDAMLDGRQHEFRRTYFDARIAARSDLHYVAAFDVAPLLRSRARSHHDRPYPEPFPERATITFVRDLVQLLEELPGLVLIYKPKRLDALERRFPTRLTEYRELLERMRRHERGVVLDSEANPWIPLAMADVCVSMPDSSPLWAALHYGIPAFFHDPLHMRIVRDEALAAYYTGDYPALREKVQQLLAADPAQLRRDWTWAPVLAPLLGRPPGRNGNAAFREWLAGSGVRARGYPLRSSVEVPALAPVGE